ncbi:MAG: hypothetical protein JWO02_1462 [Solirubrobacterales bacterium]|nr:hypothetical protein [Solirubrobacterales bacterium]
MTGAAPIDPAVQRLLAGELAKSLWATAKPQDDGNGQGAPPAGAADTFATLFTDALADAIAGTDGR